MRDRRSAVGPHPRWEETEVLLVIGSLSGASTVAEGAWASRDLLEAGGPLARESIALAAAQLRDADSMLLVRAVRERCQKPNGTPAGIEAARGWMNLRVLELRCRLGAEIFYRAFRDRVRTLLDEVEAKEAAGQSAKKGVKGRSKGSAVTWPDLVPRIPGGPASSPRTDAWFAAAVLGQLPSVQLELLLADAGIQADRALLHGHTMQDAGRESRAESRIWQEFAPLFPAAEQVSRGRSRGEDAELGLDVRSGSARSGGSGNGTNPMVTAHSPVAMWLLWLTPFPITWAVGAHFAWEFASVVACVAEAVKTLIKVVVWGFEHSVHALVGFWCLALDGVGALAVNLVGDSASISGALAGMAHDIARAWTVACYGSLALLGGAMVMRLGLGKICCAVFHKGRYRPRAKGPQTWREAVSESLSWAGRECSCAVAGDGAAAGNVARPAALGNLSYAPTNKYRLSIREQAKRIGVKLREHVPAQCEEVPERYREWAVVSPAEYDCFPWQEHTGGRFALAYGIGKHKGRYREGLLETADPKRSLIRFVEDDDSSEGRSRRNKKGTLYHLGSVLDLRHDAGSLGSSDPGTVSVSGVPSEAYPWQEALERAGRCELDSAFGLEALGGVDLKFNPDIWVFLEHALRAATAVIRASLYTLDKKLLEVLTSAARHGIEVYLILDKGQAISPRCSTQHMTMRLLSEWRVQMRLRRPRQGAGMMSAQHEKVWLVDRACLMVGSANATGNSLENCEETVVVLSREAAIAKYEGHFAGLWATSEPVPWELLKQKEDARVDERARRLPRGSAKARERSASVVREETEAPGESGRP